MAERERILSSKRYKLDHEPFDWEKEYLELMDDAWRDWDNDAVSEEVAGEKEQLHETD